LIENLSCVKYKREQILDCPELYGTRAKNFREALARNGFSDVEAVIGPGILVCL
jgi:hypothetical protein